jgi:Putative MetA-pathway of phenol degradation
MKSLNNSLVHGLTVLFFVMEAQSVSAAAITFNSALPVAKGEFVNREQVVLMRSEHEPGGLQRNMQVNSLVSVLGYGVSGKLAAFIALPYADKELRLSMNGSRVGRSNDDFGDLTIFGRYTFWQQDAPGQTFRIAGFGGVKAPTGSDDESDNLGRLPISVQPGTGAWDGFGGIVATYQTLEYQLDGQLAYRANGSAHSFEAGDETRLDASLQYRLWPRTLDADLVGFLYGVLETNLVYRDRNETHGQDDPNTGGTTLFLTPGLQFVTKRVILEVAVQLPVSQNLNGTALETDYLLRTGFRWNF